MKEKNLFLPGTLVVGFADDPPTPEHELLPIHELKKLSLPEMLNALPRIGLQEGWVLRARMPTIICVDGTRLSVQAGRHLCCTPRADRGPYTHVEVGFPSKRPPSHWKEYCEDWEHPTETVYAYVPIEDVLFFIGSCGGMDRDKTFANFRYSVW